MCSLFLAFLQPPSSTLEPRGWAAAEFTSSVRSDLLEGLRPGVIHPWLRRWTKDGFASCWGTPCSTVQSSPGSLLPDCGDGGGGDDHTGAVEELVGCGSQVLRARRDTQPSGSTVVGRWSGGALEEPRFRGAWTGRGWGNHISSTPSGTSSSPPRVVGMNEGPHVRGCSGHRTMPKALGRSAPSTLRREYPYPTNQPNPAG